MASALHTVNDNQLSANIGVCQNKTTLMMMASSTDDVISQFLNQGLFHVLENIFLRLDPESKSACSKVSATWKEIVRFFYSSANPRYQTSILRNLSKIWERNSPRPIAFEPAFTASGLDVVQPLDMVFDDLHIVISVLVRVTDEGDAGSRLRNKIVVLDSDDFSVIQSFDVDTCFGFKSLYPMSVVLHMTEDHLFVNVKTSKKLMANLIFDRQNDFSCNVIYKDSALSDKESQIAGGAHLGCIKATKAIIGDDFIKFPIREHNYEDCSVAFHRTVTFEDDFSTKIVSSYTKLNTTLPVVNTVAIPASKKILIQEFDFRNNYLSKLGYYDESGELIWEIVKPKFYSKIIAVDKVQAAVLWQSGRVEDGDRTDQIHLLNIADGSLASCMDITYTEIIGTGHLNHGRLAMQVVTICDRDVVIVDLVARKVLFNCKATFNVDGIGSVICLRENHFMMAVENNLYSLKY